MTKRHRRLVLSIAAALAGTAAAGTAVLAGGDGGMKPPPGPPFEIGPDGRPPAHVRSVPIDPGSGRSGSVGRECLVPRPPRPGESDPCSMRLLPPGTTVEVGE